MKPSAKTKEKFKAVIWDYYHTNGRHDLPWRKTNDAYHIFVSEVMLQQTQVSRVLIKYPQFLKAFPTLEALACAPQSRVLKQWQGMGYNRRALYLQRAAQVIVNQHGGVVPETFETLLLLPGIGNGTAGSIPAFAYNKPTVFIETNIRRVFIYFFFTHHEQVRDADIAALVHDTVDMKNPREWYWALMDYGSYLAKQGGNPNRKSTGYHKQSTFEGSNRQVRGAILKALLQKNALSTKQLSIVTGKGLTRIVSNLDALEKEGFVEKKGRSWCLKNG